MLDDVLVPALYSLNGYQVAPDTTQIVYWYLSDERHTALNVMRLDTGDMKRHSTELDGVLATPLTWLPDASGFIYTVRSSDHTQTLFLARSGAEDPVKLFETPPDVEELRHAVSADGAAVTVDFSTRNPTGNQASLYLIDLGKPGDAVLVDSELTDPYHAMRFEVAWSPYANELVYHATPDGSLPPPTGTPAVTPDIRPFMLYRADGSRQALGDPSDYAPASWLSADRFLVDLDTSFQILDTGGRPPVSHRKRSWSQPVPSPDRRKVAFLDDTAAGDAQVHVMDCYSGVVAVVGQGSSFFNGLFVPTFDSELRWSPDGSWLAWNRSLDGRFLPESGNNELYAYEVGSSTTRLITAELASTAPRYPLVQVTWLPEGNVLNYLVHSATGYEITLTDLAAGTTLVIADMAELNCWLLRAWPTNGEVLWNHCGDGVYLSTIDNGGSVESTRLLAGDIGSLVLTDDRETAVMQRFSFGNVEPPGAANRNWRLYDISGQRLHELAETSAIPCCGSLVQQSP
ncbi:MAG: hypothetical protein R3E50_05790 [Halioglobus sp.]